MIVRLFVLSIAALCAAGPGDPVEAAPLTALTGLQPGRWVLSSRDGDFPTRALCLGDARVLLQIRQPIAGCTQFVIANEPQSTTIHYTCPGVGHGRTTVRLETSRLAQIETQGVSRNAPFDLSIEARRTGSCDALSLR